MFGVFFFLFADEMRFVRLAWTMFVDLLCRQHIDALPCELLSAVEEKAMQYDCIGIDEGQFVRSFLLLLIPFLLNCAGIILMALYEVHSWKKNLSMTDVFFFLGGFLWVGDVCGAWWWFAVHGCCAFL